MARSPYQPLQGLLALIQLPWHMFHLHPSQRQRKRRKPKGPRYLQRTFDPRLGKAIPRPKTLLLDLGNVKLFLHNNTFQFLQLPAVTASYFYCSKEKRRRQKEQEKFEKGEWKKGEPEFSLLSTALCDRFFFDPFLLPDCSSSLHFSFPLLLLSLLLLPLLFSLLLLSLLLLSLLLLSSLPV